jgi:GTPase SAR1 family protein
MPGLELAHTFTGAPEGEFHIAWSLDGTLLASGAAQGEVAIWAEADASPRIMRDHETGYVSGLAWRPGRMMLATASHDHTVRLWEMDKHENISRVFCQLKDVTPTGVAWSPSGSRLAVTDNNGGIGIWDVQNSTLIHEVRMHQGHVFRPSWSADGKIVITSGTDKVINVYAADDLQLLRKLRGHNNNVDDTALSPDGRLIASVSLDQTARVWDLASGAEVAILEGHNSLLTCVRFSANAEFLASMSAAEVRIWRCLDWECVATIPQTAGSYIGGLDFHPSKPVLAIRNHLVRVNYCYRMDYDLLRGSVDPSRDSVARSSLRRYINAKVVLLGDTGVGKSGLGLVLSGQPYRPTDSTHGRNVWMFDTRRVQVPNRGEQTREVLLWDLAGQPGYRLVHQLHLNEVAVALVVFDSRSETDPFSGVKHWVRALAQARRLEGPAAVPLRCYLVAARADRGGVAVTRERIQAVISEFGLDGFFETSAKEGWQIAELTQEIRENIAWDALPIVSSSELFDSIKQYLLEEKQQGRLLCTPDDLFRGFVRTLPDNAGNEDLRASFETCIGRVESRGLIRHLHFGDLVLLQPELLDAYASAMVQAAKEEPEGLGYIPEEEALAGRFRMADSERIPDPGQEKLLLIATIEELLRHEIALKEATERGVDLVFPSQFTRERPDAPEIPGTAVTFGFEGPLHSIYATLAVRLSQSTLFRRKDMWQNAASYEAAGGGTCGIHLRELEEGRGELALFYDEQTADAARIAFETYVAGHLKLRALPGTVSTQRTRVCSACGYVLPAELIRRRRERGSTAIRCPDCEASIISLVDDEPSSPGGATAAEMNRSADERRDQNVAATRLMGKIETHDYDVFLCYNSKDREHVKAIGERLKERGILPWLDIWEIRPGTQWQKELQKRLKSIRSAAVFIGPTGPGPWQNLEMELLLQQIAKRNRPLIPVILAGRKGNPRLPAFFGLWHAVDMREPDPDPLDQLVWGIVGKRDFMP